MKLVLCAMGLVAAAAVPAVFAQTVCATLNGGNDVCAGAMPQLAVQPGVDMQVLRSDPAYSAKRCNPGGSHHEPHGKRHTSVVSQGMAATCSFGFG